MSSQEPDFIAHVIDQWSNAISVSLFRIDRLTVLHFSSQGVVECQELVVVVFEQLCCRLLGLIDLDFVVRVVSVVGEEGCDADSC